MTFTILYEDEAMIIVNKSSGIVSQVDLRDGKTIGFLLNQYYLSKGHTNQYIAAVHRIDQAVSGVLVIAKTESAAQELSKQFSDHQTEKTYHALVKDCPVPEEGELTHYLVHHTRNNKSKAYNKPVSNAKTSVLNYRLLQKTKTFSLLEIKPKEGRTHQIRCQLGAVSSPIKGDLKYGFARSNKEGGICLHAYSITFTHPVTKEKMSITAPYPDTSSWAILGK